MWIRVCPDLISTCYYKLAYVMSHCCWGGSYSVNIRHGSIQFLLGLLFPLLPVFIFCHFCWLQWLTRQFGDVWLFIISEGVSGLELKSFILDWFSRSYLLFFFITWPLHSASLSTLLFWVVECSLIHVYTLRVVCEWLRVTGTDSLYIYIERFLFYFFFHIFSWGHQTPNTSLSL